MNNKQTQATRKQRNANQSKQQSNTQAKKQHLDGLRLGPERGAGIVLHKFLRMSGCTGVGGWGLGALVREGLEAQGLSGARGRFASQARLRQCDTLRTSQNQKSWPFHGWNLSIWRVHSWNVRRKEGHGTTNKHIF